MTEDIGSEDVLFVGLGSSVSGYYRTMLPALALGCDWIGVRGQPPNLSLRSALTRNGIAEPNFEDYRIVVVQQVHGTRWLRKIRELQARGIVVLYEIDDYIHGIHKVADHMAREFFSKQKLKEHELCIRAADGLIVSTPFLAERYRSLNRKIWICRNAIDMRRYTKFQVPSRNTINIGWAGGTGHKEAVLPWLSTIERILASYPEARFLSLGEPYAAYLNQSFREQVVSIPAASIENYPAALTNFDIAIAPAALSHFYRGKSDLRFIESAALKIPVVADAFHYDAIDDRVTGLRVDTPDEAYGAIKELIEDSDLRHQLGGNAFEYVKRERDIEIGAGEWETAFLRSFEEVAA